ncbi:beta-microseminoprotein-like [Scophthalmus maximus]|uniref:beta-microseminoprotein-like n=1 Tax=Scophthalmus maximus TaxID=52904 RepID=UPI000F2E708F|nr:beta-microseminoprotein-like [Scophthalmus maximus]
MTATMKYLSVAVLLCGLLSLSDAQCFAKSMKPGMTHCQDEEDGTWHEVGSTWRDSHCNECSCSGCCSVYSTPRHFPSDCVSVFDSEACVYRVHKKDDPTVQCPIYAEVGK